MDIYPSNMDIHKLGKQSFGYIPGPSGETPMSNLQRLLSRWVSMMQKSLPKQQEKKNRLEDTTQL